MIGANSNPALFKDRGLYIGNVRGARAFATTKDGWLTGRIYTEHVWSATDNEAVCLSHAPAFQGKPHDMTSGCPHGFYAYVDGSNDYQRPADVAGIIQGYGEVLVGSRGFRAMGARILALTIDEGVPYELHSKILSNYRGIPFFPNFEAMVLAFPPDISRAVAADAA